MVTNLNYITFISGIY